MLDKGGWGSEAFVLEMVKSAGYLYVGRIRILGILLAGRFRNHHNPPGIRVGEIPKGTDAADVFAAHNIVMQILCSATI